MADSQIVKPNDHWNARLNLDSQIHSSSMHNPSQLNQNDVKNDEQLEPELRRNIDQVVQSKLSIPYSDTCQEPVSSQFPDKDHCRQDFQDNQKPELSQNGKQLLPVDSNIETDTCERPTVRKPSLVSSTYSKGQKRKKSKAQNDKFQQKQNSSQAVAVTQKHVRIQSQNTIKYMPQDDQQSTQISQRNLQTQFENAQRLLTDLSREFQYVGDFAMIRKQLIELAGSKHLKIMQNTSDFVTVKATSKLDYCQCLIKSCINVEEMGGIYQLKNSVYKRNKAKFVLITGNQGDFLKFFRCLLIRLWNLKCLKLKKDEFVQFFVNAEKENKNMKELKKEYTQLYNDLSGLSGQSKGSGQSQSQSLIASIKQNISKLRPSSQKKIAQKINTKWKQVVDYSEKVNSRFAELKQKLFTLEDSLEYGRAVLERELETEVYFHEFPVWKLFGFFYKSEYECFNLKREEILQNYSMRRIFCFLQIQEQYSLFLVQRGRLSHQQQDKDKQKVKSCQLMTKHPSDGQTPPVPYQECIKLVQSMNSCAMIPSKFLQKASQFYSQLKKSYTQLYSQKSLVCTCSMDDELPVTIFILLMAELNDSRSLAMNLLGKVRWMLRWVDCQENNSQLQVTVNNVNYDKRENFAQKKKILTMLDAAFVFLIKQWRQHEQQAGKDQQQK